MSKFLSAPVVSFRTSIYWFISIRPLLIEGFSLWNPSLIISILLSIVSFWTFFYFLFILKPLMFLPVFNWLVFSWPEISILLFSSFLFNVSFLRMFVVIVFGFNIPTNLFQSIFKLINYLLSKLILLPFNVNMAYILLLLP